MIDFPKPIVAALKKPAQGLGAKLVSLCDLVCDEVRKCIPVIRIREANGSFMSKVNSSLCDMEWLKDVHAEIF